jgi:acyl carrier protein
MPASDEVDAIQESVRRYLLETSLRGERPENVADDLRLRSSGILDSLATIRLIAFLEKRFGIEILPYETGIDRFDTIADVAALIVGKVAAGASTPVKSTQEKRS